MNKKGFTLIELAIVLVIIGVVTAGSMKLMNGTVNSSKQTSSKNSLDTAIKELTEYSARAQRLPSAADIGLAVKNTRDAFGTELFYSPDAALINPAVSGGVSSICSITGTDTTVRVCADAACTTPTRTVQNVAFFIASAGENENFQYSLTTTSDDSQFSVYTQGVAVDGFATDGTTLQANDDLTGWITLDTLKTYAGCVGSALDITQDKLPPISNGNTYRYRLTPKGGVGPYTWCVESSDTTNAQTLTYSQSPTESIKNLNACAGTDYVTAESIELRSSMAMTIADSSPSSALIRVRLIDSQQMAVNKQYSVPVIKGYELAMAAKAAEDEEEEEEVIEEEEEEDDEVISGSGGFSGFYSTSNYITTATADTVTFHGTSVLNKRWGRRSSMYNQAACIWLSCNMPGSASNLCPSFTRSKMAIYFDYTPENFGTFTYWWSTYATAYGFTFAVVKSYKPVWTYNSSTNTSSITGNLSTVSDCGESISGLGYAKRDNSAGAMFGNSFAVEFDRWQTSEDLSYKNDPYRNLSNYGHIAIVSNKSTTTTTHNRGWHSPSYSTTYGHAYNVHNGNSYSSSKTFNSSYNDACTTTANSGGCFLDPDVVKNNTKNSVRIEAFSGCNSTGTTCTGASNYICVYVWKSATSSLSAAVQTTMKDTSKFYKFPGAAASDVGNPIVKDCFPDTAGNYTLDSIRYGFTIGSGNSDQASSTSIPDYSLKLENFKHNFVAY